ncbi:type II toxin-antitoxin system VapC family toxin [Halochromatium glycolicum]|jgi:tRNA(fMet)-specific endonuclease VapC|uniref:type II toxin-antitoxin system VapC family toxin n=1 Tax=Halochromatium glycolicum TaxID=85075 RepID=UPI001F5B0C78|nr:type II toxin-antitoxin system VapC family toxin [Halochromatium glycolicum]
MSGLLMLDTNALSAVMKARSPDLDLRLSIAPFCISVVTEDEIRFGPARRPQRVEFVGLAETVLGGIDIRPWTSATARRYGPPARRASRPGQAPSPHGPDDRRPRPGRGRHPDHQ